MSLKLFILINIPGDDRFWFCKLHSKHIKRNVSCKKYDINTRQLAIKWYRVNSCCSNSKYNEISIWNNISIKNMAVIHINLFSITKLTCKRSLLPLHFPNNDQDENIKCPQKRPTSESSLLSLHSWKNDISILKL